MTWFKRIFLLIGVNIAVIAVLMTVVSVFGINTNYLTPNGLNLTALAVVSLVVGFAGAFISLGISRMTAKWMMKIRIIENPENDLEAFLTNKIQQFAQQGGFKTPELGVYESAEINAFATGPTKNRSLVAFSSGLLNAMDKDEIEGVLAHEMAHIKNGDMVTMTLVQGVINTFVIFASRVAAYAAMQAMGRDNEAIGGIVYFVVSMAFQVLFGILASLVVNAFSRWREFGADYGGAQFAGKAKMIAGLQFLQKNHGQVDPSNPSLATMKINDKGSFAEWWSTHPALDKRIEALQKAPIA